MANVTPRFIDSFSHQNVTVTLGQGMYSSVSASTVPDFVTSPIRGNSSHSLRVTSTQQRYVQQNIAAGTRVVTSSFYVRFLTNVPAEDTELCQFTNANGTGRFAFDAGTGKFEVRVGASAAVQGGPVISADTWYRVVVEMDSSTGTATVKACIDGGTDFSQTSSQTAADITGIFLGRIGTVTTARTWYYSAWWVSGTDGDYETAKAWSSHDVECLYPASDGTHNITTSGDFDSNTATAFSNSTTDGYTYLNTVAVPAAPTANDSIRQDLGATTNYMEFNWPTPTAVSADGIDGMRAVCCHVESAALGAALAEARVYLADGTTEVLTAAGLSMVDSTQDPGNTPTFRRNQLAPPGGSWSAAEATGMKLRLGYGDNNPDVVFWSPRLEVLTHDDPAGGFFIPIIVVPA